MAASSRKLTFPGHDGQMLAARLDLPAGPPRAQALFAHCFTCSKDIFAASRIAQALAARGIAVLRFDFTGLGASEGEFANTTFSSNVADLVAAAAHLRGMGSPPQLLIGHSLGGAAVLAAAGDIPEVAAIATIAAPADASHVVHNFHADLATIEAEGRAEVTLAGRRFTITREFLEDVQESRLAGRIAALKKPLVVFHAPRDETVGIDNASAIFKAAKHPKSFVSLDGADHLLSRHEDAVYVAEVLAAWASRYLPDASAEAGDGEEHPNLVRVTETGVTAFQQRVTVGGHEMLADEPADVGGGGTGPTPYDFVAIGLAACTAMTLRMYANHKKLDLGRVTVTVDHAKVHAKDCAECGEGREGRIDRFERVIAIEGETAPDLRAKLAEIAGKCPVHRTLEGSSAVVTRIEGD
jgi:putative redox protein